MNINNLQELYGFLTGNGLSGLCPESQNFVSCMDIFSRMCPCDPQQAKINKFNQCKQLYVSFASRAQNFAPVLLSKSNTSRMSFFLNNQLIKSINR